MQEIILCFIFFIISFIITEYLISKINKKINSNISKRFIKFNIQGIALTINIVLLNYYLFPYFEENVQFFLKCALVVVIIAIIIIIILLFLSKNLKNNDINNL